MTRTHRRGPRVVATALLVGVLAAPALPVDLAGTVWLTAGRSVANVKRLGRAKSDASLAFQFAGNGAATAVDAFERRFTGTWRVANRKGTKVELVLDAASTELLGSALAQDIERAILARGGGAVDVTADVTSVSAQATVNGKGTKMRFRLKARAVGYADADPTRRNATYVVSTKGEPAFR